MATSDRSYWLVYLKASRRSVKIQAFRDWILGENASDMEKSGQQIPAGMSKTA